MSFLRKWITGDKGTQEVKRPQVKRDDVYQTVTDDQPHNPYSEAHLLHGHSYSILHITNIDNKRFATVSEDYLVIVWDAETGCRLQILRGHTAAVTCALSLHLSSEKGLLMTGSLDNSLRLWSLNSEETMLLQEGPCVRVMTEHEGPVRCLTQLNHNLICSGGRDLCIWDRNGVLLDRFDRSSLQETSQCTPVDLTVT
jgi:WD40 repeat protein